MTDIRYGCFEQNTPGKVAVLAHLGALVVTARGGYAPQSILPARCVDRGDDRGDDRCNNR